MNMINISSEELGEAIFCLLKDNPGLLAKNAKMTPGIVRNEAAAQSLLLDFMERRIDNFDGIPEDIVSLMAAFISQFLHDLAFGSLQNSQWQAPRSSPPADQARHVIAALLRQTTHHRQPLVQ